MKTPRFQEKVNPEIHAYLAGFNRYFTHSQKVTRL